jgi:hypothetical protein
MARRKAKPATGAGQTAGSVTPDEFREMERRVAEEAGRQSRDPWARQMEAIRERRRRGHLVNRKMPEIVGALMTPPEEVRLPADFAVAWGSDRASLLKVIKRPLTAEETEAVAGAMAVLIDHNRRLRLLAQDLVDRLEKACNAVNCVQAHVNQQVAAIRNVWIAGETYLDVEED